MVDGKIEYHHSDASLHYQSYRGSVSGCPHCDYVQGWRDPKYPDWLSESQVRAIVFVDSGQWQKKGRAMIVSECPVCFKKSFHHWPLKYLRRRPFLDREIIQKEIDRLVAAATAEWERSLCSRCSVVKENNEDEFGRYIVCDGRMGPPEQPDEEECFRCKQFKEIEK